MSQQELPKGVIYFTLAYLLLAVFGALNSHNYEFIIYIVVVLVFAAFLYVLNRKLNLPKSLLWLFSVWGLLHMGGGLLSIPAHLPASEGPSVLYNLWLIPNIFKYDQLVHAYGFGVTTWACWLGIKSFLPGPKIKPTGGKLLLAVMASNGFGALNEIIEFFATLLIENTNVGGYINTGWDLVFNLLGSLITATVIYIASKE